MSSGELAHYGVKGMKWGVRRAEKKAALNAPNKRYGQGARSQDKSLYGNHGVKRINRRMNKGKSLKKARSAEMRLQVGAGVAAIGAYHVARNFQILGPVLAQGIAMKAQTNRGRAAAAQTMGLPRQGSSGPNYSKKNRKGVYNISSM